MWWLLMLSPDDKLEVSDPCNLKFAQKREHNDSSNWIPCIFNNWTLRLGPSDWKSSTKSTPSSPRFTTDAWSGWNTKQRAFNFLLDKLLQPNDIMQVIHTVLYTFLMMPTKRICLTVKSFLILRSFPVISWP